MILLSVVNVIGPILLIVLAGYAYAKLHPAEMTFVNRANMDIFVPALIFSSLTHGEWSLNALGPILIVAAVIVLLPGILSIPLVKILKLDHRVVIPPIMFNNSGNLGIPLIVFAFGEQYLPLAVLLFIVETFLHFSVGMVIVNRGKGSIDFLRSPIIWATVLAIVAHETAVEMPMAIDRGIKLIGEIAIPLMLFGLGTRMKDASFKGFSLPLISGIWIPITGLLSAGVGIYFVQNFVSENNFSQDYLNVIWLFAILPPAVLNYLVSERYLETPEQKKQVAELVLWGNLSCIIPLIIGLSLML